MNEFSSNEDFVIGPVLLLELQFGPPDIIKSHQENCGSYNCCYRSLVLFWKIVHKTRWKRGQYYLLADLHCRYAVGRRTSGFFAAGGGTRVAILRIMARTRRLSPSDSVVLKRLISPRKRISSCESSPSIFCVSRSRGVSVPGKKSASEMSMASAIFASVSSDGTVWPFSTRER